MDKIINEINEIQEGLGLKYKDKTKQRRLKTAIAQYIAKYGKRPKNAADVALFLAQELVKKRTHKPKTDRRTLDRRKKAEKQATDQQALMNKWRNMGAMPGAAPAPTTATQLPPQPANVFSGTNQSAAATSLNQGTNADRVAAIQRVLNTADPRSASAINFSLIPADRERKDSSGKEDKHVPAPPPATPPRPPRPPGLIRPPSHEFKFGNDTFKLDYSNPDGLRREAERAMGVINKYTGDLEKKGSMQREREFKRRFIEAEDAKWKMDTLYNELKDDFKGRTKELTALSKTERMSLFRQKQKYKDWAASEAANINKELDQQGWGADATDDKDVTSNIQIGNWMKDVPGFQYVLSRNQPLKIVKPANGAGQRSWIMNLSPLGERGTHWVAILQTPTSLEYFNSLGDDVPRDIVANMLRLPGASTQKFKENALETQSKSTSNCGYHAMKFIIDRMTKSFPEATGFSDAEKDRSKEGEEALKDWREQYPAFKVIGGFAQPGPSAALNNALDNREVLNVTVERAPIHSALQAFMRLISAGRIPQAMRDAQYDKLFHLSVVLELEDGSRVRLEKNETVQLSRYSQRPDTDVMPAGNPSCTLHEFVQRGADYQGGSFWTWEVQNNCQVFVNSLLEGNHLMTSALKQFVLQDIKSIFKSSPSWLEPMFNGVTKVAARLRNIWDRIFS